MPRIGWREWLGLPELGVAAIKAKVDTGARSSALHAFDIELFERDGERWVRFSIHPVQRDRHAVVAAEAPLVGERLVRPSTGKAQRRPVIRTAVTLGERSWPIEITLVRRDLMGFRMLLGREAIRRRFVVDAGRSFLIPRLEGEDEEAARGRVHPRRRLAAPQALSEGAERAQPATRPEGEPT